jgi:hypothetical protein
MKSDCAHLTAERTEGLPENRLTTDPRITDPLYWERVLRSYGSSLWAGQSVRENGKDEERRSCSPTKHVRAPTTWKTATQTSRPKMICCPLSMRLAGLASDAEKLESTKPGAPSKSVALQDYFSRLPLGSALGVWDTASSEQRAALRPELQRKGRAYLQTHAADPGSHIYRRLRAMLTPDPIMVSSPAPGLTPLLN